MRFAIVLGVLAALLGGGWYGLRAVFDAPGPLAVERDVVVHHGDNAVVAASLQRGGVLPPGAWAALSFRVAARLTRDDGRVHAAEFAFPAHASLHRILLILRHARPVQHHVTVPEGLTAVQITALLRGAPFMTGDVGPIADGEILPQTIAYEYGTPRARIASTLADMMRKTLDRVWDGRESDDAIPDPHALLVLASMVERETASAGERPLVARVFLNRLHAHMRLQSDPTVIYAASHGAQTGGLLADGTGDRRMPLGHADLAIASPYNTYVVEGLPPGPICAPGLQALEAAAHPAQGDALYFVADGAGVTDFAATLDAHNRNVAARRRAGH